MNKKASPEKLSLLRQVPEFKSCTDRELSELARLVDEVDVPEGHVLIREGEIGREAFVIIDGWAAVTIHGEPVAALGPGQFVGEMALLDHSPRSATVVAKTPMHVLAVSPKVFGTLVSTPTVGRGLARSLASRLREADVALVEGIRSDES
jgi:CRP/FNR family transcriptional regulator, cyclic AMP receptor protein